MEKSEHVPTIHQLVDRVIDGIEYAARAQTLEEADPYRDHAKKALLSLICRLVREEAPFGECPCGAAMDEKGCPNGH